MLEPAKIVKPFPVAFVTGLQQRGERLTQGTPPENLALFDRLDLLIDLAKRRQSRGIRDGHDYGMQLLVFQMKPIYRRRSKRYIDQALSLTRLEM